MPRIVVGFWVICNHGVSRNDGNATAACCAKNPFRARRLALRLDLSPDHSRIVANSYITVIWLTPTSEESR